MTIWCVRCKEEHAEQSGIDLPAGWSWIQVRGEPCFCCPRCAPSNTACSRTPTVADLEDKNNLVGVG